MEEMVKDTNCAYCMQGGLVAKFGYPVCEMKTGFLYIFKEQSKKGRVILAHKKHVSELIDLTDEERNDYFAEIAQVSRAVHKVFNPDKVNYGAYGDTGCHLHSAGPWRGLSREERRGRTGSLGRLRPGRQVPEGLLLPPFLMPGPKTPPLLHTGLVFHIFFLIIIEYLHKCP